MRVAEWTRRLLDYSSLWLFLAVFMVLGSLSNKFLEFQNLINITVQSSAIAVAATGMTLVLLTAGVDLSVGSVMFVVVAVAGKMLSSEQPIWLAVFAACGIGLACGTLNAILITRFKIVAFIATLAMLFIVRGFGLWLTNTRAMNMPDQVTHLGATKFLGLPLPVWAMATVVLLAHVLLTRTVVGRHIYAVGNDMEAARKAGIRTDRVLATTYILCGLCAALSGLIALSQTGAVSPSFGEEREFAAIAAAVLGGTSLFGGRGGVLPGTLLGAVLIQTVENGLVIINANPYVYPLVTSLVIFVAVCLDSLRAKWKSRRIGSATRRWDCRIKSLKCHSAVVASQSAPYIEPEH